MKFFINGLITAGLISLAALQGCDTTESEPVVSPNPIDTTPEDTTPPDTTPMVKTYSNKVDPNCVETTYECQCEYKTDDHFQVETPIMDTTMAIGETFTLQFCYNSEDVITLDPENQSVYIDCGQDDPKQHFVRNESFTRSWEIESSFANWDATVNNFVSYDLSGKSCKFTIAEYEDESINTVFEFSLNIE